MAYKHLIQKDIPFVTYPLDQKSSNGYFDAYSIYTSQSASVLNNSKTFSTSNALPSYEVPLVNGNNVSNYFGGTASAFYLKVPGFLFLTERNRFKDQSIEFWIRLSPSDVSSTEKWIMRDWYGFNTSGIPSGISMKDQHIIFTYGGDNINLKDQKTLSLPIDKFNQPLHIVAGTTKGAMFLICNGIKVSQSFTTPPSLPTYNVNDDYIVFGSSYSSMEISCISIYDYVLSDTTIYQHYIKGQGYSIPSEYYKDLSAFSYSMNLQSDKITYYQVKNTPLNANSYEQWSALFDAGAITATNGLKINPTSNSIFLSSQNKNYNTEFLRKATGTFTLNSGTSSGAILQKGNIVQISPISKYSLDSTNSFWIESTITASSIFAAGSSATLYYLYSTNSLSNVWIYQERATASKNVTKYVISDWGGNAAASGYFSASISAGEAFVVGIAKYSEGIYLYQKTGNPPTVTSSYSFGIGADSNYSWISSTNSLRIGSQTDTGGVAYSSIAGDNSYLGYVKSIKFGLPYAYTNNDDTLPYHLMQYQPSTGKMAYGMYNEKLSTEKIQLASIAKLESDGYYIYNNRLDFSFPDQDNISTSSSAIKIQINSYISGVLTSSVRIFSSSQCIVYPASYSELSAISSSAISFDIIFNTDDVDTYLPHLSYFKFYGLQSSSLVVNTGTPNISLFNKNNNGLGMLPPAKLTPFINNSIEDSGLLLSGSGNYAEIPLSFSTSSTTAISSYIYAPSTIAGLTQAPVFSIGNSPLLTITNSGASININTSFVSKIYINGASLTPTSGSVAFYKDRWVSVGIVLTNAISNSSGSVLTIGSKSSSAIPYFVDELLFIGKTMADKDFKSLYDLQVSGYAYPVNIIKDGASATYDLTKTYGSTSSSRVSIAFMDKEISASAIALSDKIQLFTGENKSGSVNYVKALKTSSVSVNASYTAFSDQFIDGYRLQNGDKVLVYDGDTNQESYSFNISGFTQTNTQKFLAIDLTTSSDVENYNKMLNSVKASPPKSWSITIPSYPSLSGSYVSSYYAPYLDLGTLGSSQNVYLSSSIITDLIFLSSSVAAGTQIKLTSGDASTAGIYTVSVSSGSVVYPSSTKVALDDKKLFFVSEGQQYADIYCSVDRISGNLKLNIFEDRYKVKYISR